MQLAFSTNAYLNYSFAEATRRLAAIGYRGVEIMADVPHAWPAFLLPEQKQALRDALARNHLAISNVNAFMMHAVNDARQRYWHPSWIEPDRHYRQVRIDHTRRALTLARELGARCITTEPGGPVEAGGSWAAALKLFVEGLKPVADHAEKEGVLLLVEPEPGLLIETADQFLELMQHIDSPAVGMNYDVGHAYCVGEDPATTIPRVAKFIRHFHLEDIAATRGPSAPHPRRRRHRLPRRAPRDQGHRLRRLADHRAVSLRREPGRGRRPRPAADHGGAGRRMNRLQPYAQLVRLPNLPTALADIALGALAIGAWAEPRRWPIYLLLMLASACLYCGGMAWNDFFDREQDRLERPDRPLPSGKITPRQAALCATGLVAAGAAFAFLAGLSRADG